MSMTLDLYTLKWSTTNFCDIVQVYKDLDEELAHVRDEYARAMEPVKKAYYQGAMRALLSAEDKLLEKLVNLLEENGDISALDAVADDYETKLRKSRPVMELLVQQISF
jgi:hypothetical protein